MIHGRTRCGLPVKSQGIVIIVPDRGATERRYWRRCGETAMRINGWLFVALLFLFALWGKV